MSAQHDERLAAMREAEIERERWYVRLLEEQSAELAALVDDSGFLHRWGDGYCGYVFDVITKALNAEGIETHEPRRSPVSKRKPLAPNLRAQVYAKHGLKCVECGEDEIAKLTIDHVIPLAKGGTDDFDNLQPLCRMCNTKKGTR